MSFFFSLPRLYFGTRLADHIEGSPGNDIITGLGGDDRIEAGAGNDLVIAGDGNDQIEGGDGSDLISGGRGFDTAIYSGSISDYRLPQITRLSDIFFTMTDADGDQDILNDIEAIRFTASSYTLYLDGRNNAVLAGDDAVSTDEDGALAISARDLTANDRDFDGDQISVTAVSGTSTAGASVSLASGVVSYDPGSIFQHLNEGETAVDSFTYTVDDGRGGTGTATVEVTITGANDAAVITGDASGLVTEAGGAGSGTPAATGRLVADDVDNDDRFRAAGDQSSVMGYGTYSIDEEGNWTYTLDNDNADVDALGDGESLTDSFPVVSTDGTEQDVTITINGADEAAPVAPRINEIHYDNAGTDTGEFIEIRVAVGADVSGLLVELYNGNGGSTYGSADVSSLSMTSDGEYDYYVWELPANGVQNGAPDGVALSDNGTLIEFLSYEGSFTASNGAAAGTTSTDIGVAEAGNETAGLSLQRTGDGPADWVGPQDQTPGAANESDPGGGGEPTAYLISEVQGSGTASFLVGEYVLVSAIVTYTVADGFYLQEEDGDADGDSTTSEGIFVFTGGTPSVTVGDYVEVAGTVAEYFDFTEITDVTDIISISSGNAQPSSAAITLSPDFAANLEHYEGMAITLASGTDDPLTVIENFDLDRYGEITVSAGSQYQPTQIYDPTTQQEEIQALMEANANNRLTLDDGSSAQNPDEFRYVPASVGDNGNGYLDAGDTFTEDGPTLRLGAELVGSVDGVLSYSFGEYKMLVDGVLPVDETTNGLARPDAPDDLGGRLTVSSFNLLNFFTTLDDGSGAGSGPNNLEPRGATTAEDLARQTDKIVEAMLQIDASVFGLQELENNGFDDASAIATLVDALNAAAEPGVTYAFVDPTEPGSDGFIGTDAITTGLIYKTNEVSLVASDFLVFDDGDQQQSRPAVTATFAEISTGEQFTVSVNHLKSKGGTGTGADADQGDGQGAFNATRTAAAQQLAEWLSADNPDGYLAQNDVSDSDVLIIGDLNSYAQEDPVDALRDAGYADLIDSFIGQENAFSYIFDGQQGTLDQGLSSQSLASQVSGVAEWHINAQEPDLLSYSTEFKNPAFYNDDVYGTSDHDPLLIGLNLGDNVLVA
ncbi:ExeM/NucH family extracellular endonuclease [Neorhizobium sp. Rsf11]|uniref:ExeM/NucH family extracellular endonuclease n=2 Tax=Neorhizobium TaxID=1525371 RepID=A0ABV0M3D7_9HYPH|nr:ExeM/NucH family extracellular endonuclease [Neorhizobium petrolearium]MCC2612014.1 ExeM/NucH family extracellular endonuclease [Neorhizobium petrolearium]WGI67175.1 ExeM/NucH family extracellular endonuclease [Neorhizobium petrolearium]